MYSIDSLLSIIMFLFCIIMLLFAIDIISLNLMIIIIFFLYIDLIIFVHNLISINWTVNTSMYIFFPNYYCLIIISFSEFIFSCDVFLIIFISTFLITLYTQQNLTLLSLTQIYYHLLKSLISSSMNCYYLHHMVLILASTRMYYDESIYYSCFCEEIIDYDEI
jgi:hypothetical protein